MLDREFLDLIYQQWTKTTGAEDRYWMPEEANPPGIGESWDGSDDWSIYAVNEAQEKQFLGSVISEADADFICAMHGCIKDLVTRLHESLDEADRLDEERDGQEVRIARLEQEADEREQIITNLEAMLANPEDR